MAGERREGLMDMAAFGFDLSRRPQEQPDRDTDSELSRATRTNVATRVLIVEDDAALATLLRRACDGMGFEAMALSDEASLTASWQMPLPDIIVLDLNLGFEDGLDYLERLVARGFSGPVMLISGCDPRVLSFSEKICEKLGIPLTVSLNKPFSVQVFGEKLKGLKPRASGYLRHEIEAGIVQRRFVPFFQPIMAIDGRELCGAEVLARWRHTDQGLIMPSAFIDAVERSGLMEGLALSLMEQALQQSLSWQGLDHPVQISLNVSPSILLSHGFADHLLQALEQAGGRPENLKIEITESVAFAGLDAIMRVLTRLRIAGIRISLDDFGTGYSSLTALHRLPFSDMKIDRSFVSRMLVDRDAATIVSSLISLAHNLGLEVVAEGVEDHETLALLQELGCDRAQGFLFAEPLPGDAFRSWLGDTGKNVATG
jgi:EAL domain-containing protein (putative c-di-GMP-specific phosphodiesterase class I)